MTPLSERYLRWRERFQTALDERLFPIGHLDGLIASGRANFWSNGQAAVVAGLNRYPGGALVIEGLIAAGEIEQIKTLIAEAEAWGRGHGATLARVDSRSGWVRALRSNGYALHQSTLIKEL